MNKFPVVVLAAIGLGALAWSCSDPSSTSPLDLDRPALHHAPDHGKGGGGNDGGGGGGGKGDDGGSTTVALADAMTTATAQPVKGKENKRSISYSTDQNAGGRGTIEMNFASAVATYDAGGCWTDPAGIDASALAAELVGAGNEAALAIDFDKTADGVASINHGATSQYGDFRIGLPPHREPIGTMVSDDGTIAIMEFTGGVVRVWRISDGAKLFCPNDGGDVVTATLTR